MTSLQNGNYNARSMNGLSDIYANNIVCDSVDTINANITNDLTVGGNLSIPNFSDVESTLTDHDQRLTGITYTAGTDTTTIDNNVIIPTKLSMAGATSTKNLNVNGTGAFGTSINSYGGFSGRPLSVMDPNALVNITRLSTTSPAGFELWSWNPTTNTRTSNVLFNGGDQLGDSLSCLFRTGGDKQIWKVTQTLFDVGSTLASTSMRIRGTYLQIDGKIQQPSSTTINEMTAITLYANQNLTQSGTGIISQTGTGTNQLKGTNFIADIDVSGNINFTGNLTKNGSPYIPPATTIAIISDNTSGNYYIPFTKTTASSSNSLFIDDTTSPFTYNPNIGQIINDATTASLSLATSYIGCRGDTTSNYIGVSSGNSVSAGNLLNVCYGYESGKTLTTGFENTFIGYKAGNLNATGKYSVAVGAYALEKCTALNAYNTAIGRNSMKNITTGNFNTSVGYSSGDTSNVLSSYNTSIGYIAGTGMNGDYNTALGYGAFKDNNGSISESTCIGYNSQTTGIKSTTLGANTTAGANGTAIGYGASAGANEIKLGTATETVVIPNTITFEDNSIMNAYELRPLSDCEIHSFLSGKNISSSTYDILVADTATYTAATANVARFTAIKLYKGQVINGVGFFVTFPSGGAIGNHYVALYSKGIASSSPAGAQRLAVSALTLPTAGVFNYIDFTSPYTIPKTDIYYVSSLQTTTNQAYQGTRNNSRNSYNFNTTTTGTLDRRQQAGSMSGGVYPTQIATTQAWTAAENIIFYYAVY